MDLKITAALIFLAIPVTIPPYLQYAHDIPATTSLGLIILLYLPIWYKLRKNSEVTG